MLVVTGKLLWSQRAAATFSIPLDLSGSWADFEKYEDAAITNSACVFLYVWPACFLILAFAKFVLMLQMDIFPVNFLGCERKQQHFPTGIGKSHGHSPRKPPSAVTLLRSNKGKSRFPFSSQHSVLVAHHCPALPHTCKPCGKSCGYQTFCLLAQRQKRDWEGVRVFIHCGQPHRTSFQLLRSILRKRRGETKTET